MSTITSPKIIKTLLENEGAYPGDPPAARIYKYGNPRAAGKHWAVFWSDRHDDMATSEYVMNPVLLMENGILTEAGTQELQRFNDTEVES